MEVDVKKAWMYSEYSDVYNDFYNMYDDGYKSTYGFQEKTEYEYADKYDQLFKQDGNFKELALDFMRMRGDGLTSDRECAAFAYIYENSVPFKCLREVNKEYYDDLEREQGVFISPVAELASSQIDKAYDCYCENQMEVETRCIKTLVANELLKNDVQTIDYQDLRDAVQREIEYREEKANRFKQLSNRDSRER